MILPTPSRYNPALALAWACALFLCACQPDKPEASSGSAGAKHYFSMQLESHPVFLQLALTEAEQARGLMHRESLEPDHGMLFVFQKPGQRAFWMRNTRIPLDLAYLDASGTVLELHKLYPYDERPVQSRSKDISLVLEMNRGWFAAQGLGVGSRLDAKAIHQAIRRRGHNPADYSIRPAVQSKQP